MKTILCYGDSNTWGCDPKTETRFDHKTRWPMVLWGLLNKGSAPDDPEYWVVEEGLCGRTSCREDPVEGDRNGLRQLLPILESHAPLDIVVVLLGTNDLKHRFNPSPHDVARGAQKVVTAIQDSRTGPEGGSPKILLICPPPTVASPGFDQLFLPMFGNCREMSTKLPPFFELAAKESGVEWFDAGRIIQSSPADGIHLDGPEHRKLAEAVADRIRKM